MTTTIDDIMRSDGYITAATAAKTVGRDLSTIHRWAQDDKVESARSARLLYIGLASLKAFHAGNEPILKRLDALGGTPSACDQK